MDLNHRCLFHIVKTASRATTQGLPAGMFPRQAIIGQEASQTAWKSAILVVFALIMFAGAGPWTPLSEDQVVIFLYVALIVGVSVQLGGLLWYYAKRPDLMANLTALLKLLVTMPLFWLAFAATSIFIWMALMAKHSMQNFGGP